jgi:hypothetical protein
MEVPRISGVDYSAKRLAAALCTKIPPNFETPTLLGNARKILSLYRIGGGIL